MSINHSLKPVMEDKDEGWKFQIMERVLEVCSPEYLYPYPVCLIWNNYFRIRYGKNNKQCCGSGSIFGHKDAANSGSGSGKNEYGSTTLIIRNFDAYILSSS
jgi:hypothetical protein